MFSTTHLAEQEEGDFDLLTQLVVYGLAERSSSGAEESGSGDKRRATHEPKEVSNAICPRLGDPSVTGRHCETARSIRTTHLQRHSGNL